MASASEAHADDHGHGAENARALWAAPPTREAPNGATRANPR